VLFFSHGRVASALIRVRGRGNRSSRRGNRKNRRALSRARSRAILRSLVPAESESRPGSSLISTAVVRLTVDALYIPCVYYNCKSYSNKNSLRHSLAGCRAVQRINRLSSHHSPVILHIVNALRYLSVCFALAGTWRGRETES